MEFPMRIFNELLNLSHEVEWIEFKHNNENPDEIGEYISALSNTAALFGKIKGYLIWGVKDLTHEVVGTTFNPTTQKIGSEELENWLLHLLSPQINFQFHEMHFNDLPVVLLEISAAIHHPVQFKGTEFIRIGSYKKKLKDHPEKERELWKTFEKKPFEREIASENLSADEVLRILDYPTYFHLLSTPLPEGKDGILSALEADELIVKNDGGTWNVYNLGAILFAKKLSDFRTLRRKAPRVIIYQGEGRVKTIREQDGTKGYAAGFEGLIDYITTHLPSNEVIGQALRKEVPMFPELAIRELVANAIIHQDFRLTGTAPMVEIFSNRMEITNPGLPLVETDRFLDSPPRSRNEALASFMRRIGVCEERGSGIDKVVSQTEFYQLPAPIFETTNQHTRSVLFAHRELKAMDKEDKIRACYLHSCLKYVERDFMTNATLRERFGIGMKNSAIASRIIRDTLEAKLIRPYDEESGRKFMKYVPFWA